MRTEPRRRDQAGNVKAVIDDILRRLGNFEELRLITV